MAENTTLARPYAQALVVLANETKRLEYWSNTLALLDQVIADPAMQPLIGNPNIPQRDILTLMADICGDQIDDTVKQLLEVLAENGRLTVLAEIRELFEIERAKAEGSVLAEIVSARELTDAQKEKLETALKQRFGREVTLECEVDASLLGGAIIRAGDLVLDGSASGKLSRLAAELVN